MSRIKNLSRHKITLLFTTRITKYPKQLNIRPLTQEYILLIGNIHEETTKKLDLKFQKAKQILIQKVKYYCKDSSPESAFEIFRQNKETQELEESFDVCLQLIDNWLETIKNYSELNSIIN